MKSKILSLVVQPNVDEIRISPRWNVLTAVTCRMGAIIPLDPGERSSALPLRGRSSKNRRKVRSKTPPQPTALAKVLKPKAPDATMRTQAQVKADETLLSDQGRL